jgi:hypothetical protein
MGAGTLSALAKMGAAPDANSNNVTTTILRTVFFMFSPVVNWVHFIGRSIAFACCLGRTKWAFSNLRKSRKVFGLNGLATHRCVRPLGEWQDTVYPRTMYLSG